MIAIPAGLPIVEVGHVRMRDALQRLMDSGLEYRLDSLSKLLRAPVSTVASALKANPYIFECVKYGVWKLKE